MLRFFFLFFFLPKTCALISEIRLRKLVDEREKMIEQVNRFIFL